MNEAQKIFCRDSLTDILLIFRSADFVGYDPDLLYAQIGCQSLYLLICLYATCAGVRLRPQTDPVLRRTSSQMLQSGFHVHDYDIVAHDNLDERSGASG